MRKLRRGESLFQLIDRKSFNALVLRWGVDKGIRNLTTWEFTQALICCFVMKLESYREIEKSLMIPDSTFGDALRQRHFGFFQELCDLTLIQIRGRTQDRKVKKAIREIFAIDSSEIKVHGSLFDEAGWKQKKCKDEHKASAKLHVVWSVDGEWIEDYRITGSRRGDSPVSLQFKLLPNKTYVFDRAYNDILFWLKIIDAGSHFVTRLKISATARKAEIKISSKDGVVYDGIYEPNLGSIQEVPRERRLSVRFRHIIYRDPLTKKLYHFVTSDFESPAQSIADIYKKRWSVELLFRWLKGHLDIRYLPVKTPNAVKSLLAAAVLVQLLLQLKKILDHFHGTLWDLLQNIRTSLISKILACSDPPDDCRWNPATMAKLAA